MAEEIPLEDQKKLVLPFMQRAQEIEKVDPKVAYYCRLYAIEQALSIPKRAKEINALVSAAISRLEKDKAALTLDKDQDKVHCEAFALRIFANSDRADRLGKADQGTSKGFYAASCFLDVLNQFGPLDADLTGKQKYALWRAAEIRKAVREGRLPVPPPSGEDVPPAAAANDNLAGSFTGVQIPESRLAPFDGTSGPLTLLGAYTAGAVPAFPPLLPPPPEIAPHPSFRVPGISSAPSLGAGGLDTPGGGGAAPLPGQRYRPGSPVFYCAAAGVGGNAEEERGTMGLVSLGEDGMFTYRVALKDRIVQANDMQVAPAPGEGATVAFTARPGGLPVPVKVVLVNDGMGWPPTYLITLPDGSETAAQAHQISLVMPEETAVTTRPPPGVLQPPLPPPPGVPGVGGGGYPSIGAHDAQRHGSFQAAPPPPGAPPAGPGPSWGAQLPDRLPPPPAGGSWSPEQQQQPPPAPAAGPTPASLYATTRPFPAAPGAVAAAAAAAPPQAAAAGWIMLSALPPGHKPSVQAITEAQKAARMALSSLNFEDCVSAVKYLTHAIQLLTGQAQPPAAHR